MVAITAPATVGAVRDDGYVGVARGVQVVWVKVGTVVATSASTDLAPALLRISNLEARADTADLGGQYRPITDPSSIFADLEAPKDTELANYLYTWPGASGVGNGSLKVDGDGKPMFALGDRFGYTRPSDNKFYAWVLTRAQYDIHPWYTLSAFRTHSGLGGEQKAIVKRLCDNLMTDYQPGNDCRFVRARIDGNLHAFEYITTRRDVHPALAGPALCRLVSEGYSFTWSTGLAQYLRAEMIVIDDKKQYIVLRTPDTSNDLTLRPVTDTAQSIYRAL